MKSAVAIAILGALTVQGSGAVLLGVQPIYDGAVDSDKNFAVSAQDGQPARPPGYRNAWDDCGGVGASATERMRTIASKIKGWAKPLPFIRHAAQDCLAQPSGVSCRIFGMDPAARCVSAPGRPRKPFKHLAL